MKLLDELATAGLVIGALRSQWWDERRIRGYQEQALLKVMRHAITRVPYYRALGLDPGSIATASDLKRFPVLTKRDLQRAPESFLAEGFARDTLYASRTSGSSGQPTTTYFDRHAWLLGRYALKMRRIAATSPLPIGCRVLIISERKPEELAALVAATPSGLRPFVRQLRLSIHEPVADHLATIIRWRPQILYTFPSYLLDLIALAERRGEALPPIRTVYTSSEVLTPAAREQIERALCASVCDIYGSTEFKEVAWQCRFGRDHLNFESVHIEQQESGAAGPVVLTSLMNLAMPLLRFSIGDRAVFGSNGCSCGRQSPYLLSTAIESEESIRQYRIVQAALDAFRIDVIVSAPGDSLRWRERLCGELRRILGGAIAVAVREVDELPRAPGSKRSVFQRAALAAG
jgi:phenylacetate-CoA ligase